MATLCQSNCANKSFLLLSTKFLLGLFILFITFFLNAYNMTFAPCASQSSVDFVYNKHTLAFEQIDFHRLSALAAKSKQNEQRATKYKTILIQTFIMANAITDWTEHKNKNSIWFHLIFDSYDFDHFLDLPIDRHFDSVQSMLSTDSGFSHSGSVRTIKLWLIMKKKRLNQKNWLANSHDSHKKCMGGRKADNSDEKWRMNTNFRRQQWNLFAYDISPKLIANDWIPFWHSKISIQLSYEFGFFVNANKTINSETMSFDFCLETETQKEKKIHRGKNVHVSRTLMLVGCKHATLANSF